MKNILNTFVKEFVEAGKALAVIFIALGLLSVVSSIHYAGKDEISISNKHDNYKIEENLNYSYNYYSFAKEQNELNFVEYNDGMYETLEFTYGITDTDKLVNYLNEGHVNYNSEEDIIKSIYYNNEKNVGVEFYKFEKFQPISPFNYHMKNAIKLLVLLVIIAFVVSIPFSIEQLLKVKFRGFEDVDEEQIKEKEDL